MLLFIKSYFGEKRGVKMKNNKFNSVVILVGPIAAGKGTVASILKEQKYTPFNYGDIIFTERTKRGLSEERKNSHAVALDLRIKYGNDIIAKKLSTLIDDFDWPDKERNILIDGLRHPDEVVWFKQNFGALVIGVTASPEVRFKRVLKRNAVVDPKNQTGFYEVDGEDRGVDVGENGNHTDACLVLADAVIENNGDDVKEYREKFFKTCEELGIKIDKNELLVKKRK